jgi:hypothetical protein
MISGLSLDLNIAGYAAALVITLVSGFQTCYKFLKEAGEMTSGTKAIALFILFAGAHDERNVTAIRNVFPSRLRVGPVGFDVVR